MSSSMIVGFVGVMIPAIATGENLDPVDRPENMDPRATIPNSEIHFTRDVP